ncbi:hypothetical protein [Bacillus gaemokensis]|uniref:Uncharacterized protein n=1 Tax=Bacillus gaemokensis TaxID=574375 RepID=A0A073KF45_9BACI|nr:hypothetical protein [Bacillus gaemokensis]KEK25057.1 hypothetical protein BAGA_18375 [Bacillus gaemokensis]KYG32556.1 hypothetical protein AZF08_10630 [Bacillus gaemokensis]
MRKRTYDIPIELRREWFLVELAYLTKKYGIEIATREREQLPFLKDQITKLNIGVGLQYDKYDEEYIINL